MRRCDAPSQRKGTGFQLRFTTPLVPTPNSLVPRSSPPAVDEPTEVSERHSDCEGKETQTQQPFAKKRSYVLPRPAGVTGGSEEEKSCSGDRFAQVPPLPVHHTYKAEPEPELCAPPARKPFAMSFTPLSRVPGKPSNGDLPARDEEPVYLEVFFTKQSKKKKKVWEDGVLVVKDGGSELQREDGATVTKSNKIKGPPDIGSLIFLGSFEVEVVCCITEEQYVQKGMDRLGSGSSSTLMMTPQPFKSVAMKKPLFLKKREAKLEEKAMLEKEKAESESSSSTPATAPRGTAAPVSRTPATANIIIDPTRAGAHVLNGIRNDAVLVCVDPFIGLKLKPHQIEGVKFMYTNITKDIPQIGEQPAHSKCVGGGGIQGCILADEMGLGKTIQTIALMWTVLKQSPVSSTSPLCRKCVVVCPSSLVFNWQAECKRWLGDHRMQTLAVLKGGKGAADVIEEFVAGNVKPVLVISYDMLRRHCAALAKCLDLQLLVCDEAHKLKNINGNHTIDALISLPAKRRILLSGTPVQNDLQEFYAMMNLVHPGLLGTPKMFQKLFADGIVKSRDKRCSEADQRLGRKRLAKLAKLTGPLLLRRTMADKLICASMPPKLEILVFCNPSPLQRDLYLALLRSAETQRAIRENKQGGAFAVIARVIKLLNHPTLLLQQDQREEGPQEEEEEGRVADVRLGAAAATVAVDMDFVKQHFPAEYDLNRHNLDHSGKLAFVFALLTSVQSSTADRFVLVSNYTTTLDILETFCAAANFKFLRLDGSVSCDKRRDLVESFNKDKSDVFIFLLSSQAGGVGLNLVGANRLVLIDPSWNPAHDLQAMARVWRFGQFKPCYIYRLFTAGSMEEKVFQKQLRKGELESLVIDNGADSTTRNFDSSDLKDIFTLEKTACDTFDVLSGNGIISKNLSGRMPLENLQQLRVASYRCTRPELDGKLSFSVSTPHDLSSQDECLALSIRACASVVSFIMWKANTDNADGSESKESKHGGGAGGGPQADSSDSDDASDDAPRATAPLVGDLSDGDDMFAPHKSQGKSVSTEESQGNKDHEASMMEDLMAPAHAERGDAKRRRLALRESDSE